MTDQAKSLLLSLKQFAKRDLTLVDQSQWSIRLTLWGKQAENFVHEDQPVIAAKGVKVGDFGGELRRGAGEFGDDLSRLIEIIDTRVSQADHCRCLVRAR